jgi:Mg2+-importing ATPase
MGNPFKSRPSAPLAVTTIAVVAFGLALPVTPLAPTLGFAMPPRAYFAFLVIAVLTYLALVEVVKRRLARRLR